MKEEQVTALSTFVGDDVVLIALKHLGRLQCRVSSRTS
jgi:hypothetical protein